MKTYSNKNNFNRKIYLDILRIMAIFFVLFTHTGIRGSKLYTITNNNFLRYIYVIFDCFRTINNPILFMISGTLLLGKEETIKEIWMKRVVRFLVVLVIFTYIQAIYNCIINETFDEFNIKNIFINMLNGPIRTPYWYLYSYISFLVMLPFLRKIAANINEKEFIYLFFITIITMDLFPLICIAFNIEKINFSVFLNSFTTVFPLFGFYIDKNWQEGIQMYKKYKWFYPLLLITSITGIGIAALLTIWNFNKTGNWEEKYITMFYSIVAVFIFITIKQFSESFFNNVKFENKEFIYKIIKFTSGTMFGIYLLENILEAVTNFIYIGLSAFMPSIIACFIWILVTMFLGIIVVGAIKKIPKVNNIL